ncbi:hypothetical protein LEP1GSC039_0957 [Leptospira santarosai str. 2000027870]|uniref:hypothetical protein n=1 Tax=Leptospira santarosai TaxID=28183 RepID=UPI0002BE2B79|nr:hypothetical protein [Leptospira santarosai]EMM87219.1 hypothetical protein LEP1GSC039_0957 [Leptospira santarosai str. 2000027870]
MQSFYYSTDDLRVNIREEARLLNFNSYMSGQGYRIQNLKYNDELAVLDLYDLEEYPDLAYRAIFSSQFLFNLWNFSGSSRLIVNYYLSNDQKYFSAQINAQSFLKYSGVEVGIEEILEEVQFQFIDLDFEQDKDPFLNLNFSKRALSNPQIFYSQQGANITVEEFSKQFLQSIFSNYLVLISEGFSEVFINIGSDGSAQRVESPKSIVFHVPAKIENEALQIELMRLIENIIYLYERKILKKEIVDQAKLSNKYYEKKSRIKDILLIV